MRILISGNMGYVGPVLVAHLRAIFPDSELHGLDSGFFAHCLSDRRAFPERLVDVQHFGDVRRVDPELLRGFDAVVQLAAVSNDPMGKQFERATMSINRDAAVGIAEAAARAGVRAFVFASSCSVYGIAQGGPRTEADPVAPETAYARSKVDTEVALRELDTGMTITCLRFATACGFSPRLRLDLVLNDFVSAALTGGKVVVLSDGSPWRPLIDVADMARAMEWAITRSPDDGGRFLVVNAGASANNYQVRDIAEAVAAAIPGTEVSINSAAPVDSRSYRVDFSAFERLAPRHVPQVGLSQSIENIIRGLNGTDLKRDGAKLIRLHVLQQHIEAGRLTPDLEWTA
jgi:UDP-glucose 4-epimerase